MCYLWDPQWSLQKVKFLLNAWTLVEQRHLLKYSHRGACQSGELPQRVGTPSNPRDTGQSTLETGGPPGLIVQGAIIDKLAEDDSTVQKVSTAKPNYLGQQVGNSRKLMQV